MRGFGLSIGREPPPARREIRFAHSRPPRPQGAQKGRGKKAAATPPPRLTETSIEPILLSQRLTTGGDTISMCRARPDQFRSCRRRAETCGREIMPIVANRLVTTSLVVFTALAAMPAR